MVDPRCAGSRAGDAGFRREGNLVGKNQLGDGQPVFPGSGEKSFRRAKGEGNGTLAAASAAWRELLGGEDEAPADGVEDLLREEFARAVPGRKTHAVGVGWRAGIRVHLVAMQPQVPRRSERNAVPAEQGKHPGRAQRRELRLHLRRIHGVRSFAKQAEQHGTICRVADAGKRERAVEIDRKLRSLLEQAAALEGTRKAQGGPHRPDGVGAGRADTDLEEFEETGVHAERGAAGGRLFIVGGGVRKWYSAFGAGLLDWRHSNGLAGGIRQVHGSFQDTLRGGLRH